MRTCTFSLLALLSFSVFGVRPASAQSAGAANLQGEISADLGSCSALISVTDADSKPVYGAKVSTRIQYGMMGVKRLDLEAYTGADGKMKLAKLPDSLKKPMFIHVLKGDKDEMVEFKPAVRCHATFDVQLK